jgi:hypothetical protein
MVHTILILRSLHTPSTKAYICSSIEKEWLYGFELSASQIAYIPIQPYRGGRDIHSTTCGGDPAKKFSLVTKERFTNSFYLIRFEF